MKRMEVITVRVEWAADDGKPVARERRMVVHGDVTPGKLKEMVEGVRRDLAETEPRFKV